MKKIKLDHIERLSRGKKSGANIGSRSVGHYLQPHERAAYQRALKKGYLDINEKGRANIWHIWEKACQAKDWTFIVLIKQTQNGLATIYRDNTEIETKPLKIAKQNAQALASSNANT